MILVLVPMMLEIIFVGVLTFQLSLAEKDYERLLHSKDALLQLARFGRMNVESVARLVKPGTFISDEQKAEVDKLISIYDARMGFPGLDVSQYPELKELFDEAESNRTHILSFLKEVRRDMANRDLSDMSRQTRMHLLDAAFSIVIEAGPLTNHIMDIEMKLHQSEPAEMARTWTALSIIIFAGIIVSCIFSAVLAHLFTVDFRHRLNVIAQNAHLLAGGRQLKWPVSGGDEISELDGVLHQSSQVLADARRKELAILDNTVDVICSLDSKLKFVTAGAAVSKVWKYTPDELLGMSVVSLVTADTIEDTRRELKEIGESGGEKSFRNIVKCKDGSLKDSEWTVTFSPSDRQYFCVVHDITELRQVERLKERFLAIVNHDLRSPLTALSFSFNFLLEGQRGELPPPAEKELKKMNSNLGRLMDLVSDFLELEKLDSGKMAIEFDPVSISDVSKIAIDSLSPLASSLHVSIETGPINQFVLGDQRRLIQVLTNLLSNALKFSPANSIVSVSASNDNGFVRINVTDRGPGVSTEDRSMIFEKFRQSSSTSSSIKGTGLGLAIVKAIVEAHHGTVGLESEPGKGSTFFVVLPQYILLDEEDEK